jgi:hypothetical protein
MKRVWLGYLPSSRVVACFVVLGCLVGVVREATAELRGEDLRRRETVASLAFLSQHGDLLPRPDSVAERAAFYKTRTPREWLIALQNSVRRRPYSGSLQTPEQVLQSGEANSLDRARLLEALLLATGHQARVVSISDLPPSLQPDAGASTPGLPAAAIKKLESEVAALAPALWKQIEAQPALKAQWLQSIKPLSSEFFWTQVFENNHWDDLLPADSKLSPAQIARAQLLTPEQLAAQTWKIKIAVTLVEAGGERELLAHEAAASALHATALTFVNAPSGSLQKFVPTLLVGEKKIEGSPIALDPKASTPPVFRLNLEVRGPNETRRFTRVLAAPSKTANDLEKGLEAASLARIAILTSSISDVEYARLISTDLKTQARLLLDPPEEKALLLMNRAACAALGLLDTSQRLSGSLGQYSRQSQAFQARPAIAIERAFVETRTENLTVRRGFDLVDPGHAFWAGKSEVAAQAAVEQGVADAVLEEWTTDAPHATTSLRALRAALQGNAVWKTGTATAEWNDASTPAAPQYLMAGEAAPRGGVRLEAGPQVVPILSNGTGGTLEDQRQAERLKDVCKVLSWSGMLIPAEIMPQGFLFSALVNYHCKLAEAYNKAASILEGLFNGGGPDADAEKKIKELENDIRGLGPQLAADAVGGALMDAGLGLAIRPVAQAARELASPILGALGRRGSEYLANAIGRGAREGGEGAMQNAARNGYNRSVAQWARRMREAGWTRAEREAFFRRYGCFVAGTRVLTPRGLRAIESLRAGDEVLSWDFAAQKIRPHRVLHLFSTGAIETVTLVLPGGERIETTPDHRFWSPSARDWLRAGELAARDPLLSAKGQHAAVRAIEHHVGARATYDLEIEGAHNYFVGKSGVLAHNGGESCLPENTGNMSENQLRQVIEDARRQLKNRTAEELERAMLAHSPSIIPRERWHPGFQSAERAVSLEDIIRDNYRRAGHAGRLPPMHVTDAQHLEQIMAGGKLEHNTSGASWSYLGTLRSGNIAIRVRPGSERFVSFTDSAGRGNTPQFWPQGVNNGRPSVDIPTQHLEYYDYEHDVWVGLNEFSPHDVPRADWAPPLPSKLD